MLSLTHWDGWTHRAYVVVCVVVLLGQCGTGAVSQHPLLLAVLFDGFRWDYMDRYSTPHMHSLIADGVRARQVQNVMPTVTMANHYTILTGTYPETHGIVANNFFDPDLGSAFHMSSNADQTDPKWFNTGVEPIWVTNQLASHTRFSGSMLWPDALAPVRGVGPTYQRGPPLFDHRVGEQARIDGVVSWFLHPDNPINLGLLYFDDPDETAHKYGPNSREVQDVVKDLDMWIGYLVRVLKEKGLYKRMNILITADHGMSEVSKQNYFNVLEYVDGAMFDDYQLTSMGFLNPKPGMQDEVYNKLKKMQDDNKEVKVYRRTDDFMKQLNYSSNSRISPIIITLDEGYYLVRGPGEIKTTTEGLHGYLPSVENMHPFFIGHGPAFKKNYTTELLNNIDFYELMCHLLEVKPAPNNGSLQNIKHILIENESNTTRATNFTLITYFCVALFCALVTGVCTIGAFRQRRMRKRVISLEEVTLFQVNDTNPEDKVPLLDEENDTKEEEL